MLQEGADSWDNHWVVSVKPGQEEEAQVKLTMSYIPLHCKKNFSIFPSPAGMPLTKLSLGGNYDVIYKLFLPRESLVSGILAGGAEI